MAPDVDAHACGALAGITATAAVNENHIGWTAGVGAEHMFGRHWTMKVEYQFTDLGKAQYRWMGTAYPGYPPCGEAPPQAFVCSFPQTTDSFPARLTVQTVRLGVNYLF